MYNTERNNRMVSDETAYRKYLAGDEAAAQLLVERYGDALTLYINGLLGDIHEAEDLMIEAFAHIFARERPIQDGCFKAYLYKTGAISHDMYPVFWTPVQN